MKLRRACLADAEALTALEALQPRAAGWGTEGIKGELSQACARIWCACTGQEIIGFLALRLAADFAEILNVAVHPAFTHRGIGRQLLETALADLKQSGVERVTLEAAEDNNPASALYASAGFNRLGIRRDFYGPGRAAYIWGKDL